MRVRILRSRRGEVDGIPLDRFAIGRVYNVPAWLATYLIVEHLAEAESDSESALVVPLKDVESSQTSRPDDEKTREQRRHQSMDKSR